MIRNGEEIRPRADLRGDMGDERDARTLSSDIEDGGHY